MDSATIVDAASELQSIISSSAQKVSEEMLSALIDGHNQGKNFLQLYNEHTAADTKKKVEALETRSYALFSLIFKAAHTIIQNHSEPLQTTLAMIQKQAGKEAPALFLSSFVYKKVEELLQKDPGLVLLFPKPSEKE